MFIWALCDSLVTVYGQQKGVALNSLEGLPMGVRLLNAVESCGEYLRQMVWPTGLAPFYSHPHMVPNGWTTEFWIKFWTYLVLLTLITGIAAWQIFRRPFMAIGWLWWLGALVPVIGIIQVGTQARADRYTYLPMIGVYVMIAWLLKEAADRWPRGRGLLAGGGLAVLAALSTASFVQVSYWKNSYKLFFHSVGVTDVEGVGLVRVDADGPDANYFGYDKQGRVNLEKADNVLKTGNNYFAYNHIGIQFDSDGKKAAKTDMNLAQRLFDHSAAAFAATLAIKPDYDFGNNNLGVYYARGGKSHDPVAAERFFRKAISVNGRYADAFNNLGIVLAEQGRELHAKGQLDKALAKLEDAARQHLSGLNVRFDRASDHNNLCGVFLEMAKIHKAAAEKAQKDRDSAKAAAESQLQAQALTAAMQQDDVALQCDPNFVGAWQTRIEILREMNKPEKTLHCYERIIEIDPTHDGIRALMALLAYHQEHKQPEKAVACLEKAGECYLALVKGKPASAEFLPMPFYLASNYQILKQPDNAALWLDREGEFFNQLTAGQPDNLDTLSNRLRIAMLYLKLKQHDQAEKAVVWLNKDLAAKDSFMPAHAARGTAFEMLGDAAAAKADYERIARGTPEERDNAAHTFYELEQPDKTIALLDPMLAGNPSAQFAAAMLTVRAAAWEMKGNLTAAKADYERILQLIEAVEAEAQKNPHARPDYERLLQSMPPKAAIQEKLKAVNEKPEKPPK